MRSPLSRRALLVGATAAPVCMPVHAVARDHPDAAIFAAIEQHRAMLRHESALRDMMPADGTEAHDVWHDEFESYAHAECEFLAEVVFGRRAQTLAGARALMAVWLREFPKVDGADLLARAFHLPCPGSGRADDFSRMV